jgi:type III restriction enzyme
MGREQTSFWLQTATDKFYPDFVCLLKDGRILIVEYKNVKDWSNDDNKEKRALGELWAERSGGKCLFVMPKGPQFAHIRQAILKANG